MFEMKTFSDIIEEWKTGGGEEVWGRDEGEKGRRGWRVLQGISGLDE